MVKTFVLILVETQNQIVNIYLNWLYLCDNMF